MRLICPNCAAQYEVDDGVIPEAGRDVQCSNCGHAWWQEREQTAAAEAPDAESAVEAADSAAPAAQPAMAEAGAVAEEARWPEEDAPWEDDALPGPSPSTLQADQTWPEAPDEDAAATAGAQPTWPEAPPETVDAPAGRPRRSLDDAVLEVLRQEAEREAHARKTEEGPAVETQPDLGLAEAPAGGVEAAARERMETMKSLDAGEAEDESGRPERRVRRSKLPDVDEINSTLAGQQVAEESDGRPAAIAAANARRSGFRTGFTLMILIAIAIGAVYAYADRIVAAAPATAPAMEVLVATLDSARIWLDRAAVSATEAITSLTEGE
jgi:predicted Zn finger-like uncharacterized protein